MILRAPNQVEQGGSPGLEFTSMSPLPAARHGSHSLTPTDHPSPPPARRLISSSPLMQSANGSGGRQSPYCNPAHHSHGSSNGKAQLHHQGHTHTGAALSLGSPLVSVASGAERLLRGHAHAREREVLPAGVAYGDRGYRHSQQEEGERTAELEHQVKKLKGERQELSLALDASRRRCKDLQEVVRRLERSARNGRWEGQGGESSVSFSLDDGKCCHGAPSTPQESRFRELSLQGITVDDRRAPPDTGEADLPPSLPRKPIYSSPTTSNTPVGQTHPTLATPPFDPPRESPQRTPQPASQSPSRSASAASASTSTSDLRTYMDSLGLDAGSPSSQASGTPPMVVGICVESASQTEPPPPPPSTREEGNMTEQVGEQPDKPDLDSAQPANGDPARLDFDGSDILLDAEAPESPLTVRFRPSASISLVESASAMIQTDDVEVKAASTLTDPLVAPAGQEVGCQAIPEENTPTIYVQASSPKMRNGKGGKGSVGVSVPDLLSIQEELSAGESESSDGENKDKMSGMMLPQLYAHLKNEWSQSAAAAARAPRLGGVNPPSLSGMGAPGSPLRARALGSTFSGFSTSAAI